VLLRGAFVLVLRVFVLVLRAFVLVLRAFVLVLRSAFFLVLLRAFVAFSLLCSAIIVLCPSSVSSASLARCLLFPRPRIWMPGPTRVRGRLWQLSLDVPCPMARQMIAWVVSGPHTVAKVTPTDKNNIVSAHATC
jgi:hypothetical protein